MEGTEAITHVSISKNGKYLCVCERGIEGQKGRFQIIDVIQQRRKKVMPEMSGSENREFQSREMVASAFCPKEEKIVVTLTGQPDW